MGLATANTRQWWKRTKEFIGQSSLHVGPGREFTGIINNKYDGDKSNFVHHVNQFLQSVTVTCN